MSVSLYSKDYIEKHKISFNLGIFIFQELNEIEIKTRSGFWLISPFFKATSRDIAIAESTIDEF